MGCGDHAVTPVLVGLHRVGVVGLRKACEAVADSGLRDREQVVDALLEELKDDNFVSDGIRTEYRTALWREYLRRQGRDFSEFYSSLQVSVRGRPSEARERLVDLCRSVLADFELQPELEIDHATGDQREPELVIGGSTVARGIPARNALKGSIRRRLSDW